MDTLIAEFMVNLMIAGLRQELVSERGYEYALALGIGQLPKGDDHVSAKLMLHCAEQLVKAKPLAERIYKSRIP
jgi:hypothetical protein